ncbi:MAG: hypothetical protein AAGA75_21360 [Cyanobacteria bacterium P01_E01_bin.6]
MNLNTPTELKENILNATSKITTHQKVTQAIDDESSASTDEPTKNPSDK